MKNIIKSALMLLGMALVNSHIIFGQEPKSAAEPLIASFLKEVYQTDNDAFEIANKYIGLNDASSEYSPEERLAIAADHIKLLRKGESLAAGTKNVLNKDNISSLLIRRYSQVNKANTPAFALDDKQYKNIYVATKQGEPLEYFYILNNKILSFDYITKGEKGQAYFFSY